MQRTKSVPGASLCHCDSFSPDTRFLRPRSAGQPDEHGSPADVSRDGRRRSEARSVGPVGSYPVGSYPVRIREGTVPANRRPHRTITQRVTIGGTYDALRYNYNREVFLASHGCGDPFRAFGSRPFTPPCTNLLDAR